MRLHALPIAETGSTNNSILNYWRRKHEKQLNSENLLTPDGEGQSWFPGCWITYIFTVRVLRECLDSRMTVGRADSRDLKHLFPYRLQFTESLLTPDDDGQGWSWAGNNGKPILSRAGRLKRGLSCWGQSMPVRFVFQFSANTGDETLTPILHC